MKAVKISDSAYESIEDEAEERGTSMSAVATERIEVTNSNRHTGEVTNSNSDEGEVTNSNSADDTVTNSNSGPALEEIETALRRIIREEQPFEAEDPAY